MGRDPNVFNVPHALEAALRHHQAGRLQEAEALYRQILQIQPNNADALHYMGILALQIGRADAAIHLIEKAIRENPGVADFHNNLGNAFKEQGKLEEAITCYEKAISLRPKDGTIHYNLGNALQAQGQHDRACACYRKTLALIPNHADAHNNLGNVLQESGNPAQAIVHYKQAIKINPEFAAAYNNRGTALQELGRLDDAIDNHRKAIRLKPDYASAHSNLLCTLNYVPGADPMAVYNEHIEFSRQHEKPLSSLIKPHQNSRTDGRRLRIGYVSADFRRHSVAYFIEPVLAHHDHGQFEIFCYSNHHTVDDATQRLKKYADHWRNIASMPDAVVAQHIRNDQIDILVDLSGHTSHNRLLVFAQKPAPIQATWLGYPNTTGLSAMDYRITDAYADPPQMTEPFHSEKLVRLPECFSCYSPPLHCPEVGDLPALKTGRVTFASFNTFAKINPVVMALWAKLLHAVPHSRLMLKYLAFGDPSVRQSVIDTFDRQGITAERLDILEKDPSQMTHLQRYNNVDIGLDPFPYNGTTTTCEALWMGVPVITLAGMTHVSRVGASQMSNLGLAELIADTPDHYLKIASELAGDTLRLSRLRAELRARMAACPLSDAVRFTYHLEISYREMWSKWCRS